MGGISFITDVCITDCCKFMIQFKLIGKLKIEIRDLNPKKWYEES